MRARHERRRTATSLPVLRVGNDDLALAFLPSVGGRLISVEVGGAELLWRNPEYLDDALGTVLPREEWAPLDGTMGSWANLGGSKTWPAPQGWSGRHEWPGPPDPVIDSGDWRPEVRRAPDGATVVTLTSPDDPWTGLRVERRFEVPAAGASFTQRDHLPVRGGPPGAVGAVGGLPGRHRDVRRGAGPRATARACGSA